jgi:hypothetical protein
MGRPSDGLSCYPKKPPTDHPPMPRPRRRAKPDRRRALELLASCRDGCLEAIMIAHGFTIAQMVELVNAGLATATAERVVRQSHDRGRAGTDHRGGAAGACIRQVTMLRARIAACT